MILILTFLVSFLSFFQVSCSDDKTLRIWQCYEPGNEEGICLTLVQRISATLFQPFPAFSTEEFLVLSHSCVQFPILFNPPSAVLSVMPCKKVFRNKGNGCRKFALNVKLRCANNHFVAKIERLAFTSAKELSYDVKFYEFTSLFPSHMHHYFYY